MFLEEPTLTRDVWQALSLAGITRLLLVLNQNFVRANSEHAGEMTLPTVAEILRSWALPAMAEAVAKDERDSEARATFAAFARLAESLKKKQTTEHE